MNRLVKLLYVAILVDFVALVTAALFWDVLGFAVSFAVMLALLEAEAVYRNFWHLSFRELIASAFHRHE